MTDFRFPNLYLAGAPKCGTTSLAYWLGQHPDVFAPIEKEPSFFGSDILIRGQRTNETRYAEIYRLWNGQKYALDASPAYFVSERAATEIHAVRPDARIILMLRNPVEALHSNFHHTRYRLTETLGTLEEALDDEARRKREREIPRFGSLQCTLYTEIYRFERNISRYLQLFGSEQVHILLLDDFQMNPRQELRRLLQAIGLDSTAADTIDLAVKNESAHARFRMLSRLAMSPPKWLGLMAKPFISLEARQRVRLKLRSLNAMRAENPPLLPETRVRLTEQFRPDIEWLSELLGRDLSHWLKC